jgi:peptidoglycan lytic transglycosylase
MEAGGYRVHPGRTSPGQVLILALLTATLSLLTLTIPAAAAADLREAALVTAAFETVPQSDPPLMLSPDAAARYERIFALQDHHAWAEADYEIARLANRLLLGEVLAQRYLSKDYHARYAELAAWLAHYADEPEAKAIYALALARKPPGATPPRPPTDAARHAAADQGANHSADASAASLPQAVKIARRIRSLIPAAPNRAAILLAGPEAKAALDPDTRAALGAEIAQAFLAAGEARAALGISAPTRDYTLTPTAQWNAGLAAWRLGRMDQARSHFNRLAREASPASWLRAAAAFWSARVALRQRHTDLTTYWLRVAAEEPRTFYGIIARRLLGLPPDLDFEAEPFTALDARVVTSFSAGRRALALLEIDQRSRATDDLRALAAATSDPILLQAIAELADRADLPALSLHLAGVLADADGRNHDHALYPVPRWQPEDGFTVDRALLFALMRQESLFVPKVTSNAGAEGLMQLMPATARYVAERKGAGLSESGRAAAEPGALADPELNLTLAQEYVRMLLEDPRIKGNLVLFALAYNRGPTATQRWQALAEQYRHDPLLFLESVPSQQARVFTEHVLTNYWIYRQRLSQPTRDLDALAAGKWPTYIALDRSPDEGGRYAANR